MTGHTHTTDATCPDCGHGEAIVRVRGNAMSSVCTGCRRADVAPMLTGVDLRIVHPELLDAEVFALDAARYGDAGGLGWDAPLPDFNGPVTDELGRPLVVELRLPVPPR